MKKIYMIILMSVCSFLIKAQYTVTSAIFPIVGDIEKTWDGDTTGLTIGSAGTNQIWNYTGLIISQTAAVSSKTYVTKTSAPNYTAFPSANMASTSDGTTYGYEYYGTNITNYGTSDGTTTVVYGNPQTIANIPFTYGTISADTYSMIIPGASETTTVIGSLTTTGDAWGTLNMPGGKSFANTLRIKLQITQFATIVATSTIMPSYTYTYNVNNYVHLSAASKWSLMSAGFSTITLKSGTITNTSKGKSITIGEAYFTGITELNDSVDFSVFPNPAKDELTISLTGNNQLTQVDVMNNLGQIVKDIQHVNYNSFNANKASINLEGLSPGIYYVKLKTNTGQGTKKIIIE